MYVVMDKRDDAEDIRSAIFRHIQMNTRFRIGNCDLNRQKRKDKITISKVRLKEAKPYCGNHPDACEIDAGPSRRGTTLEGADWVEFNDHLNDVLDRFEVSARVYSTYVPVTIRDGRRRRIRYDSHTPMNARQSEWMEFGDMEADYEDYCGLVAPNSEWPEGTPGLYERKQDDNVGASQ
jgi:hypothetical protein